MTYNANQPRVPSGNSAGGQWAGHNISRSKFDQMSATDKMNYATGGGQISDAHISELFDRITQPDGGFTYQPFSDQEPTEGFAVSIFPERSFATDVASLKFSDLVGYVVRNRDLLKHGENYLGAWHDPDTHKVFLDISQVTSSRHIATRLALAHDQVAYFDLKTKKSFTVNRGAHSGGVI